MVELCRSYSFLAAVIVSFVWTGKASSAGNDAADSDFFEKRIRPVLVSKCYECHSATSDELGGKLQLDNRAGIQRGGESGPAVVPNDPGASLLLSALRHQSFEMPPDERLSDAIIADFEQWIRSGAVDPREGEPEADIPAPEIDVNKARNEWPFNPIVEPPLPVVSRPSEVNSAIDCFIQSKLESKRLLPAPRASRVVLVRRLSIDLIGLPPSPEEIECVARDPRPDAIERLTDEYLASPRFGERWGRHWLDVSRYAESSGGGRAVLFPNAWRYRDYVVESFNADLPFDQFVTEQIAGDLIETGDANDRGRRLTALGFLAIGPKNLDTQDKELLQMDVVDEQLDTIGQAILGLTIGCARCHDHKFDPIPTRDYYALAGILRSTKTLLPGNVSGFVESSLPMSPDEQGKWDNYQSRLASLESKRKSISSKIDSMRQEVLAAGLIVDDADAVVVGNWQSSTSVPNYVGKSYLHDLNADKGTKSVLFKASLAESGAYEVRLAYTPGANRSKHVPVTVKTGEVEKTIVIDQTAPPSIASLLQPIGSIEIDTPESVEVCIGTGETEGHVVADAVQFVRMSSAGESTRPRSESLTSLQKQKARLDAAIKLLNAAKPAAIPMAMGVTEEETVGDCPLLVRGNVHQPGQPVPRGFLTVATRTSVPPISRSGRLELAQWLTSPENPLTARVFVNRAWHHLFGRGIVASTDNFGLRGERPTHPELLDALAVRFMEDDWSVKGIVRLIVSSDAYARDVSVDPATANEDLENLLFSRQSRRRLDAEVIRDSMLHVARTLDLNCGGPTIRGGTKDEFDYDFDSRRRSVYIPVFRASMLDLFEVFDFADPNIVVGRRPRTTLPTQALFFMNSPFVLAQASSAAETLLADEEATIDKRIERAFLQTLGRRPTSEEKGRVQAYLTESIQQSKTEQAAWTDVFQSLFASIDFRYSR